MEARADLEQARHAPRSTARPVVGSTIRERIFRSVDFPAPFRPISPMMSPCSISKLTSRSAQNSSLRVCPPEPLDRRRGAAASGSRRV